ncbi:MULTISPECIES: ACT domain-containing protein [unclassified Microbacterium]|uniref:ACT domain-containing protein n=1 Tax=unclassified Microbacterium TaxID=2609290 RepID=UPI0035B1AF91
MRTPTVELSSFPGAYVIARLPSGDPFPADLLTTQAIEGFVSFTRTPQEVSVVCPAELAPAGAEIDGPWMALYASGPIPFGLTGVVASLVGPLSAAGSPVFVVSTFDGDVLMVPASHGDRAREILTSAGHTLIQDRRSTR